MTEPDQLSSAWVGYAAIAQQLDVPVSSIRALHNSGRLNARSIVVGRRRVFRREDVEAWIESLAAAEGAA